MSKQRAYQLAKELGCQIGEDGYEIELRAPKGKLLNGELHISVYEIGFHKKTEIWSNLISEMNYITDCTGSKYCDCKEGNN